MYFFKNINILRYFYKELGLGIGPNPQSPILNIKIKDFYNIFIIYYNLISNIINILKIKLIFNLNI